MKKANEPFEKQDVVDSRTRSDDEQLNSDNIKDAHASGIGSLERSNENQIEKLNKSNKENDETSY